MNIKFYVLSVIMAFSVSCSSESNTKVEQVVIDDGYKTTENGEVIIEDNDLKLAQKAIVTEKESSQPNEIVSADGSKISVMVDGYGNKSETRYFDNHPRLQMILIKTAANGQKQVFVYGQNGEVKDLPQDMLDRVLISPADDLASAAGIYEGKKEKTISQNVSGVSTQSMTISLQSVAKNQTPAEIQTIETTKPQNDIQEEALARQAESTSKNDSPQETKQPQKLTETLRNYIPKKRADAITDN